MIKSLTSLRGIFILFIFFHYCLFLYPGGGTMDVTFFFVLGGFSMTLGYKDRVLQPDFNYKSYLLRRSIKFYPLHWICLLAILPITLFPFSLQKGAVLCANAALMHTLIPGSMYFSYNAVSWYLANTLFFAVLFPPLIKLILKATPKGRAMIATLFVITYIAVALLIPKDWHHDVLYISPYLRLSDFVFGIYLAIGFLSIKERESQGLLKNNVVTQFLLIGLIVLLVVESCLLPKTIRYIAPVYWLLVAFVILVASLSSGGGQIYRNNYLQRLGELSFTIFLTHQIILRYTRIVFNNFEIEQPVIYIITTLVLTIVVSDIMERFVLKPITQWLTRKNLPSMTAHS